MRNETASTRSRTSHRSTRRSSAHRYAVEPLETRQLMSTIIWANRGTGPGAGDTDGFNAQFLGDANQARLNVDRAIHDWEAVITNFNYSNGGNTYILNLQVADVPNNSLADGLVTDERGGKPTAGRIRINRGSTHWVDPSIGDDAEFSDVRNAFTGFAPTPGVVVGTDLYATVAHELGHVMGFNQPGNLTLAIEPLLFTTSLDDPNDTAPGNLVALNIGGGPIEATMTDSDFGHLWEGPGTAASNALGLPWHPDMLMNPGRAIFANERNLISDFEATLLQQIYGYTITLPSTLNNMYVNSNHTLNTLTVNSQGAGVNDFMEVRRSSTPGYLIATVGTVGGSTFYSEQVPISETDTITFDSLDGNDILRLEDNAGKPTTLNGGDGADIIDFSFTLKNLGNITGPTHVNGGIGNDQVFIYDNNVTSAQNFTITSSTFSRPGWGLLHYTSLNEGLTLNTGTGPDAVNIQSTASGQGILVNSAGGLDAVTIGNSNNGVRSIGGDIQVHNDAAASLLYINNGPDTGPRTWNVNSTGNFNYLSGMALAPAVIYWDDRDIVSVNLTCGMGLDIGTFIRSTEMFLLNNTGSDDVITVGSSTASGLGGITGELFIDNAPALTALTIDDTGYPFARTFTIDEVSGYNTISGSAAPIHFDSVDVLSATLITGNVTDTVNVLRNDEDLRINSAGGNDIVNLGNTTNGVQAITRSVTVRNTPSTSTLNINNGPDTFARNATLQNVMVGADILGQWTGLAPSTEILYRYLDVSTVNVTFGFAADPIVIRQTQKNLNLTSTGGVDTYTIGGASDGAQSVLGEITLTNPPDHNIITVDDASNSGARVPTLDDVTISGAAYGQLKEFAPATINWKYNDTTSVSLIQGSGYDSLTVRRHQKPLTIQSSGGADTVTLGGAAGIGMNGITASTTLSNSSGFTTLVLDDSTDTTATSPNTLIHEANTLLMGRITGMSPAPVDYRFGQVNTVRLRTSQGGPNNILVIHETSPLTRVFYDPGAAFETLYVNDDSIGTAALYTDRSVHPNTAYIFDGAAIYQQPGGFVFRAGVQIMSNGVLDISDGAMIYDFDEGNPLDGFREKIIQGYNGGNWQGLGIRSSTAATTPGGYVGYANASDLFNSFPATFVGESVDSSTILVRYTPGGNANLDHQVNTLDFNILAGNFGGDGKVFSQGDFDYSGEVDSVDFGILLSQYGKTLPAPSALTAPSLSPTTSSFSGAPVVESEDDTILMVA